MIKNYQKHASIKLSEHFVSNEFDCHGSGCCSSTQIDTELVEIVEKIRKHFDKPVRIGSGYRCPVHNAKVANAASRSKHMDGVAADISIAGVPAAEIAKYAESIGVLGIGLYETGGNNFVHVDTRNTKSFWYGHEQAYRATFGGATASSNSLRKNSTGTKVKELQSSLIALGYLAKGEDDGIFGAKTENAVKDFQKAKNLAVDGIAGEKTFEALKNAKPAENKTSSDEKFMVGDVVKLISRAKYTNGKTVPNYILASKLYVREIRPNGEYVISTKKEGAITGVVKEEMLVEYSTKKSNFKTYPVEITADVLNVRSGAGMNYKVIATVKKNEMYTILDERNNWGKISKGWISLDYAKKI